MTASISLLWKLTLLEHVVEASYDCKYIFAVKVDVSIWMKSYACITNVKINMNTSLDMTHKIDISSHRTRFIVIRALFLRNIPTSSRQKEGPRVYINPSAEPKSVRHFLDTTTLAALLRKLSSQLSTILLSLYFASNKYVNQQSFFCFPKTC